MAHVLDRRVAAFDVVLVAARSEKRAYDAALAMAPSLCDVTNCAFLMGCFWVSSSVDCSQQDSRVCIIATRLNAKCNMFHEF